MAANIQVVLKDDVEKLGKSGEIVKVKPGYARNFLLPRGLAVVASRGNIVQVEHEKKVAVARAAKMKADAGAVAKTLEGVSVEIAVQVGEEGKLFGSVSTKDIAEALEKKGQKIDRKKIQLAEPIKALGEYPVAVKLGYDVTGTIKVNVVKQS
ncbi:MAG TPA: 50S ribosomal protein L9 [Polyangiaceae bacterium]|jgi:large subunit ribosomal protein L9|nr:50S ribosomal protein L9 [Polyangiaceae bacterium]